MFSRRGLSSLGKAKSGGPERCFTRVGSGLTHIRLGCEGLPGTNTQDYYKYSSITGVKSFTTLGPDEGVGAQKLVHSRIVKNTNCLQKMLAYTLVQCYKQALA